MTSQAKNIFLFFVTELDASSSNLLMRLFHFLIGFDGCWGEKRGLPCLACVSRYPPPLFELRRTGRSLTPADSLLSILSLSYFYSFKKWLASHFPGVYYLFSLIKNRPQTKLSGWL